MAVDFNGVGGRIPPTTTTTADKAETKGPLPSPTVASPAVQADSVSLSSQAMDLQAVRERVSSTNDVDQARVEEIRTKIANGDFRIDANKVADAMLGLGQG